MKVPRREKLVLVHLKKLESIQMSLTPKYLKWGLVSLVSNQAQGHGILEQILCLWPCVQVPSLAKLKKKKQIIISIKLVSRRKHEVISTILLGVCADFGTDEVRSFLQPMSWICLYLVVLTPTTFNIERSYNFSNFLRN